MFFLRIFFIFIISLLVLTPVSAAQFYFGTNTTQLPLGYPSEVGVFLNTEGVSTNAFEGEIVIPDGVEVAEIRTANSIATIWIEQPHYREGVILFSGITPGGFTGSQGYLFSIIAVSRNTEPVTFASRNERVLLNDGEGTDAGIVHGSVTLGSTTVTSTDNVFIPPYDAEIPDSFTPMITRDPHIFDGQYFAVFATEDKGSGIWGYEVAERRNWFGELKSYDQLAWESAQSPYVLQDQTRKSTVYIKAIDYAGNERVVTVPPRDMVLYEHPLVWCILGSVVIVSVLLFAYGRKKTYR